MDYIIIEVPDMNDSISRIVLLGKQYQIRVHLERYRWVLVFQPHGLAGNAAAHREQRLCRSSH